MQSVPDPYRLLGLRRDATQSQIKAAHRALAKRYHPDAPGGDRARFLAVQEAYQVLSDPHQRRQWDSRHAPGPVRADDPAARARARGGGTRPAGAGGRRSPTEGTSSDGRSGQGPEGRERDLYGEGGGYTWSARNVPWWESEGPTGARRPPGRRAGGAASGRAASGRAAPTGAGSTGGRAAPGSRSAAERPEAPGPRDQGPRAPGTGADASGRSSGAAWSSASRAYFRRAAADLPRGRAGWADRPWTRPGAASEATEAAGPAAAGRRRQPGGFAPGPEASGDSQDAGAAAFPGTAARPAGGRGGAASSHRFSSQGPQLGTVRMRPWAVQDQRRPWPSVPERILLASVGWLPLALLVAYGGGAISGCASASVSCAPYVEPLQVLGMIGLLAVLTLFPRLGYYAAAGGLGLGSGAVALVFAYAAAGIPQPLPEGIGALTLAAWTGSYMLGVFAASRDWPVARPWLYRPLADDEPSAWTRRVGVTGRPFRR